MVLISKLVRNHNTATTLMSMSPILFINYINTFSQSMIPLLNQTKLYYKFCTNRCTIPTSVSGKNNKTKVTVKLCGNSEGAPGREPIMTEEERKQLMLHAYRKQEEWKKLEQDEDDHYLDSKWADGQNLKRQFHGLNNISWKPV